MKLLPFSEIDPASVMTETSALVIALLTLGVPPVPAPASWFEPEREEIEPGQPQRTHRYFLQDAKALDGTEARELIRRWHDPAWLAANPASELATLRNGLMMAVRFAAETRKSPPRLVVRKGNCRVLIPHDATPAERAHWLGKLDGTVPPGEQYKAA